MIQTTYLQVEGYATAKVKLLVQVLNVGLQELFQLDVYILTQLDLVFVMLLRITLLKKQLVMEHVFVMLTTLVLVQISVGGQEL